MASLSLVDTKLTLKFSDQNYYNSNINDASTDQTIYDLVSLMRKYQVESPSEVIKTLKYEFTNIS